MTKLKTYLIAAFVSLTAGSTVAFASLERCEEACFLEYLSCVQAGNPVQQCMDAQQTCLLRCY